jgi:hypothetical protein
VPPPGTIPAIIWPRSSSEGPENTKLSSSTRRGASWELSEILGDNGGLIIDCSIGIPDEARPENVFALTEAVHEYGVYR